MRNTYLWIAVVFAVISGVLTFFFLNGIKQNTIEGQKPVIAIVASKSIESGIFLADDQLKSIEIPRRYLPSDFLKSKKEAVGKVTKVSLSGNEVILKNNLLTRQEQESVAYFTPKGLRAYQLALDDRVSGAPSLIRDNDFIDIFATPSDSTLPKTSRLLLQRIKILRVLKAVAKAPSGKDVASNVALILALSPKDAQMLFLAQNNGRVGIVVRPVGEVQSVDLQDWEFDLSR